MANWPLPQQSSIYTLTLEELQHTLGGSGKDFGSMNMDELLKSIWTAEETQEMTPDLNLSIVNHGILQKQGSLTLPITLSQKTVEEVWKELVNENGGHGRNGFKNVDLINESNLQPQERQPTLGEMTLEMFLQKAGVAVENNQAQTNGRLRNDGLLGDGRSGFVFGFKNPNQNQGFHQQAVATKSKNKVDNLQGVRYFQQPKPQKILAKQTAFNFNTSLDVVKNTQLGSHGNEVAIIGKTDNPLKTCMVQADLFPNSNLDTSPSPASYAYGEGGVHDRKRTGTLEKVVERRCKRMIKNRESAARSRARKQVKFLNIHMAYILELEAEVAKLKELNHELKKKQEEMMESQNFQVAKKMKFSGSKRSCLRRTLTGPW
ncbi:abscisic acid-insensitive 5-like protein 7 isoform X1 [Tanacetum coccineum]|uniref:Abscisic acid-insensitive 5-like protein 7 isoform X1 n=1 Tax=Tanacetum coccineum TaxID=301880 RepID=A0ABQ5J4Y4_9ASTR